MLRARTYFGRLLHLRYSPDQERDHGRFAGPGDESGDSEDGGSLDAPSEGADVTIPEGKAIGDLSSHDGSATSAVAATAEGLAFRKSADVSARSQLKQWQGSYSSMRLAVSEGEGASLIRALDKAPVFKGTLYRGLVINDDEEDSEWTSKDLRAGAVLGMSAPSSATPHFGLAADLHAQVSTDRYQGGKKVVMVISSKSAADTSGFNPKEAEMLLREGTKYRVTRVERRAYKVGKKATHIDLVHAEEI